MNIEKKLREWKKSTVSKSELGELLGTGSDEELYQCVSAAAADGLLSPVKSCGTNGNRTYPLYMKYRIILKEDYADELAEIAVLHPAITENGYLASKPELYRKYKEQIQQVNQFLFRKEITVPISRKERSFEIFREEKQLEDSSFCHFLHRLALTPEMLGYYETPEYCFNDYIPVRKPQMTLLICENKDIWFNIRRRMYEDGAREIFCTGIDGVVYGCGNKVSENGALSAYTHFMGAEKVQYLYWGDIDRAGLNIYLSLVKNNPEAEIALFVPAYVGMLQAAGTDKIPDSEDRREQMGDYAPVYTLFPDTESRQLKEFIQENKRIPQEIINYEVLQSVMR